MSELEPNDSRNVTLNSERAPGEPPRTGPREGESRGQRQQQGGQSQSQDSNWRADEAPADAVDGREAQDQEFAGGIDGPSPRPEANDRQWGEQPGDKTPDAAPRQAYPLGVDRPGAESVDGGQLGTEPRGPRDQMEQADSSRQRDPNAWSDELDEEERREQARVGGR